MTDVSCYRFLFILISSVLVMSGCKEPDVSVGLLGKKMAAPQLKGASPFDQDFNSQKYARMQGSCDSRVGDISISFDNSTWHLVPYTPNYTGTTLAGTEVNDATCSPDGQFDFYLTEGDMTSWGIAPNSDVDYIYLRGSTMIGETQTLTLRDPKLDNGNGNNGGGPATQVVLEKVWPYGFAGANQCEYFMANVRNANGQYTTSSTEVRFNVDKKVDTVVTSGVVGYATLTDCQNGINPITVFTIPANQNSISFYYKFPSGTLDEALYFRASNVNLTQTTSNFTAVTLRDSAASRFWFATYSSGKIRANTCVPINYEARLYSGGSRYLGGESISLTASGTNSNLVYFYSDSKCNTNISTLSGGGTQIFYMKYKGTEVSDTTLPLTITHNILSTTDYDDIPTKIEVDRSASGGTLAYLDLAGPNTLQRGQCTQMNISAYGQNGALIPATLSVQLTPSLAASKFYSTQADCETFTSSTNEVSLDGTSVQVWFRPTALPGATENVTVAATGVNSTVRTYTMSTIPTTFQLLVNTFAGSISYPTSTCLKVQFEVRLTDVFNDVAYLNPWGLQFPVTVSTPSGYSLYTDTSCTNSLGSNLLGMTIGVSQSTTGLGGYFYMKADSTAFSANFMAYQTTLPAGIPYLIQGVNTITPVP